MIQDDKMSDALSPEQAQALKKAFEEKETAFVDAPAVFRQKDMDGQPRWILGSLGEVRPRAANPKPSLDRIRVVSGVGIDVQRLPDGVTPEQLKAVLGHDRVALQTQTVEMGSSPRVRVNIFSEARPADTSDIDAWKKLARGEAHSIVGGATIAVGASAAASLMGFGMFHAAAPALAALGQGAGLAQVAAGAATVSGWGLAASGALGGVISFVAGVTGWRKIDETMGTDLTHAMQPSEKQIAKLPPQAAELIRGASSRVEQEAFEDFEAAAQGVKPANLFERLANRREALSLAQKTAPPARSAAPK